MHKLFFVSLQIFTQSWDLTYFEELSKMWRNHYLPKLSVSFGLKCLLFRNSKCNFRFWNIFLLRKWCSCKFTFLIPVNVFHHVGIISGFWNVIFTIWTKEFVGIRLNFYSVFLTIIFYKYMDCKLSSSWLLR